MKIVAILGSPRKDGNTTILAREVLKAAKDAGAETVEYVLNELDFRGCQACDRCKTEREDCGQTDDLTPVLKAVEEADAVVLASPIYFSDVSGQLKLFVDRTYSFLKPDFTGRLRRGRKAVFIFAQGDSDRQAYKDVYTRYEHWLKVYGFDETHLILISGVHDPGEITKRPAVLEEARALGRELATP